MYDIKKPLAHPQILVCGRSPEVSAGVIQTESDIDILLPHLSL